MTSSIAFLVPSAHRAGGGDVWLEQLLAQIGRDLAPLVVFAQDGPLVRDAANGGCRVIVLRRRPDGSESIAAALETLIARERPGLCIAWSPRAQLYAARARARLGYASRIAWVQHVMPSQFWLHRLAANTPADAVLCVSRQVAVRHTALYPGRRVQILNPGVDVPAQLSRAAARAVLGIPAGAPAIAVVGRVEPWKGHDLAVLATARLAAQGIPVRLVFAGETASPTWPGFAQEVRASIAELGIEPLVTFLGHRTDVAETLLAFDALLCASREEGFGMAIIEAMAAGVPVLATRCGGPEDILEHGRTGLLVPPCDPAAIASAIAKVLSDPVCATRLTATARHVYLSRFTAARSADAFRRIAAALLAAPPEHVVGLDPAQSAMAKY